MKHLMIALAVLVTSGLAHAKKDCTSEPKAKWMSESDFRKKVEGLGYKITKFKQPGTCYEIYGTNAAGKKVEVYFNPVDASIVKEEID
ncbi:MAG: PepSY domain-containing protein [Proteobacteria bacterium]|jgi:hypothetical protein|nr:PepSY domain-containing protein [Pseudomonadota bacterium]